MEQNNLDQNDMAKRFISTDLFHEDWFLDLDIEVRLFFIYAFLNCDHAGVLKANLRPFNALNGCNLNADTILAQINADKQRIENLTGNRWYLTDFVEFQYGQVLNPKNRVHASVIQILQENGIEQGAIKGLNRGLVGVKDKDKDKDKDNLLVVSNKHAQAGESVPDLTAITDQFRSVLASQGLPPDAFDINILAANFENYYSSQGWRKGNGMPIVKWQPLCTQWVMREKGKNASSKPTITTKPKRSWDN